jgi:hypothetical protein
MSCLGVHFALSGEEVETLRSQPDDSSRLDYLTEEIEENYFGNQPELVVESDKSWDAVHRTLTDGNLAWDNGKYPLNHVILGGELLYRETDYIMSLKTPKQVQDVAAATSSVTEVEFRQRYFAMDQKQYGSPLSEEDFNYTWENFLSVREFFLSAAKQNRYVLFTADQ